MQLLQKRLKDEIQKKQLHCIKILIKTHAKHACLITDSMWYTKMILICIIIITVIIIAFVIPGSILPSTTDNSYSTAASCSSTTNCSQTVSCVNAMSPLWCNHCHQVGSSSWQHQLCLLLHALHVLVRNNLLRAHAKNYFAIGFE